jgi:hypothetical protein
MGWKLKRIDLCGFKRIKPNEEVDLDIELNKERRAVIHGIVKFPNGKPVFGAAVKLFEKKATGRFGSHKYRNVPVTFAFTDKHGQFLFGVKANRDYIIKLFYYKPEFKPQLKPGLKPGFSFQKKEKEETEADHNFDTAENPVPDLDFDKF